MNQQIVLSDNPSLIELDAAFKFIMAVLEQSGGELTEDQATELYKIEHQLCQKADSIDWVLKRLENEAAFYEQQANTLLSYAQRTKRAQEAIKKRLTDILASRESKELIGQNTRFYLKQTAGAVKVNDEQQIPREYFKTVISTTLEKARVAEDLKLGVKIEGCELVKSWSLAKSKGTPK